MVKFFLWPVLEGGLHGERRTIASVLLLFVIHGGAGCTGLYSHMNGMAELDCGTALVVTLSKCVLGRNATHRRI